MPSEKQPFYDPIPPTYDEALASSSRSHLEWRAPSLDDASSNNADGRPDHHESQSLLRNPNASASSSDQRRTAGGYRPPTVETDDEDSLLVSDSEDGLASDDETNQVRREMQEMEVEEPESSRASSIFGKRIAALRFGLPRWKWSWTPRIAMPRFTVQLPQRAPLASGAASSEGAGEGNGETAEDAAQTRSILPVKVNGLVALIFFIRILALFVIFGFLYLVFTSNLFGGPGRLGGGFRYNPEDLRVFLQGSVDPQRMAASLKIFSSYAHVAGTEGDYATAMDIQEMFHRAGLDEVMLDEYQVYVNYPTKDGRAVQLLNDKGEATWSAKLEEDEKGGESSGHQTFAFHGHSKSGDVKGPLIYANYGSREDFDKLKQMKINTKGAIALVRYYGSQGDRALKVKAAELAGFAGCLIYSDPAEDGFLRGEVAPKGRWMPEDGVQRGAVSLMSWVVGDVLTPGWESKPGMPRMEVNETAGLVGIPSLPLAWRDAKPLLQQLKGHGKKVPSPWQGGVPDVEWWTGDAHSPIVRLKNEQEESELQPVWNVYGKILGIEQTSKSIILGNHRDAWGFGATDPHTGTAIMVEVARIFGDLVARGWRPLRTIEFMSWDAEEYNLIGSTEFVEKNLESLRNDAVAYINLDTVITGNKLQAAGSPVMQKALIHALDRVVDPSTNATLRDLWDQNGSKLEGLGAGSDYVAFQDIAGTSSLDLAFVGDGFAYHSSYDNYDFVSNVIDPDFRYHSAMAEVVGLLLLDFADREILPFDMPNYPRQMRAWADDLKQYVDGLAKDVKNVHLNWKRLDEAIRMAQERADRFDQWEMEWNQAVLASGRWESNEVGEARIRYNNHMTDFESALLDLELGGGIPNRTQFKHVVFGPQLWSGYDAAFFPAIRDCADAGDWGATQKFIDKTAVTVRAAARQLELKTEEER